MVCRPSPEPISVPAGPSSPCVRRSWAIGHLRRGNHAQPCAPGPPTGKSLRQLTQALEVDLVALTECLVSPGYRLSFGGSEVASVHYNLAGVGRIVVEGHEPVEVHPHTPKSSSRRASSSRLRSMGRRVR